MFYIFFFLFDDTNVPNFIFFHSFNIIIPSILRQRDVPRDGERFFGKNETIKIFQETKTTDERYAVYHFFSSLSISYLYRSLFVFNIIKYNL